MLLKREDLPTNIQIKNKFYNIKTDFRSWIIFEEILKDTSIENWFKPIYLINYILLDQYEMMEKEQIINALFSFYRLNKEVKKINSHCSQIPYLYEYDMDLIYAAFMQQYNINLLDVEMHWWEFKALFDSLQDNTKFIKVISYRTRDISKIKDKNERESAKALQDYYAIPQQLNISIKSPYDIEAEILRKAKKGGELNE